MSRAGSADREFGAVASSPPICPPDWGPQRRDWLQAHTHPQPAGRYGSCGSAVALVASVWLRWQREQGSAQPRHVSLLAGARGPPTHQPPSQWSLRYSPPERAACQDSRPPIDVARQGPVCLAVATATTAVPGTQPRHASFTRRLVAFKPSPPADDGAGGPQHVGRQRRSDRGLQSRQP